MYRTSIPTTISGIPVLAKKYRLPVYITEPTLHNGGLKLEEDLILSFNSFETIIIGDLHISAFPKMHDASNPHSFIIACRDVKVGVFTDIGVACDHVVHHFKQCNAAFLEANYDDEMLEKGRYPFHLKRRIRGETGHLSNKQALALFSLHKPRFMSHLLLSHLSKNNNDPELVKELFNGCAGETNIIIASRYEESEIYHIRAESEPDRKQIAISNNKVKNGILLLPF